MVQKWLRESVKNGSGCLSRRRSRILVKRPDTPPGTRHTDSSAVRSWPLPEGGRVRMAKGRIALRLDPSTCIRTDMMDPDIMLVSSSDVVAVGRDCSMGVNVPAGVHEAELLAEITSGRVVVISLRGQ